MGQNGLVIIFSIALLFCHGFGPPLGKAQAVAVAVARDDEAASFHIQVKEGAVQSIDGLELDRKSVV